ncbi:MAG: hypothetical protein QF609_10250 [Gammaproteobacteria bacterium]|nr:hypothetical protein [Gammaproteobacteria bacterium]
MPYVVRQAVCLGIPVVDGTIVQTSRASRLLLEETRDVFCGDPPRIAVVAAVAGESAATTEDLQFACRLEARRHYVRGPATARRDSASSRSRVGSVVLRALLGLALIVGSGGHWIPALAGVWLLGLRELIGWGPSTPRAFGGAPGVAGISVRRAPHQGLAELREVMSVNLEEKLAYLEAYEASVRLGIPEAAALYTKLLLNPNPGSLSPDDGIWLPDASRARAALVSSSAGETGEDFDIDVEIVEAEIVAEETAEPGRLLDVGPEGVD